MISSGYHKLGFRQPLSYLLERFDHELETFIGSPLAECQNPVDRVSTSGKIGELGPASKNAMGAQVDVVAAVLVVQDLAIAGHQHRDRIREQQHSRGDSPRKTI